MHCGGGVGQTPDFFGNDYFGDTYFHNGTPKPAKVCISAKTGEIWAATPKGMARGSMAGFKAFGAKEGLPASNVTFLAVTADGKLWIGTPGGLACSNP